MNKIARIGIYCLIGLIIFLLFFSIIFVFANGTKQTDKEKIWNQTNKELTFKNKINHVEIMKVILDYHDYYCIRNCRSDIIVSCPDGCVNPLNNLEIRNLADTKDINLKSLEILIRTTNYTEKVDKYKKICFINEKMENGTLMNLTSCGNIKIGIDEILVWNYEDYNKFKDEKRKEWYIRIKGEKTRGESVDWVPTFNVEEEKIRAGEMAVWSDTFDNGLFAYYNCSSDIEQIQGHISSNSTNLTIAEGSPIFDLSGSQTNFGKSCNVSDGNNFYVQNETDFRLMHAGRNFTISFWINATAINTNDVIFSKAVVSDGWAISFNVDDKIQGGVLGTTTPLSPSALIVGQWHHVAITFNSSHVCIWLDGVMNSADCGANSTLTATNVPLWIGADWDSSGDFIGLLDEMAFWNRTLSTSEILDLNDSTIRDNMPPEAILITPPNANQSGVNLVTLNSTCLSSVGLANGSIYINGNLNYTKDFLDETSLQSVNITLDFGESNVDYNWTLKCTDNKSLEDWADANFTLTIDTPPNFSIIAPTGTLSSGTNIFWNMTIEEQMPQNCSYNVTGSSGTPSYINTQWVNCYSNGTFYVNGTFGASLSNGDYLFHWWMNDTLGHVNFSNFTFSVLIPSGNGGGGGGGALPQEQIEEAIGNLCVLFEPQWIDKLTLFKENPSWDTFKTMFYAGYDYILCKSASSIAVI